MDNLRIMVVCGFGLGSSMVLKLKLDSVLKAHGIKAKTFCSDITSAAGEQYDMVFTSKELLYVFSKETKPVVVVTNFLSEQEISEKGVPVIRKMLGT